jgi:parallel beta-helix repeat protein
MLLAIFTVTSNFDGDMDPRSNLLMTLRSAIQGVDASTDPSNLIKFNLPANEETITLNSPLDPITEPVDIEGSSQPGFSGSPLVTITGGNSVASSEAGLLLDDGSSGSVIDSLVINGFVPHPNIGGAFGIAVNSSDNLVTGCYIGTDVAGAVAESNTEGVAAFGSGNTIGGTSAGAGNVISGNYIGIDISGSSCLVEGNLIGTNAAGTSAVGNIAGVQVRISGQEATIGGTTARAGNVISGNNQAGIYIFGSSCLVEGNLVGTNSAGAGAVGNGAAEDAGIAVEGSSQGTTIGGTTAGAANVISGNINGGLALGRACVVEGNRIGTDSTGTEPVPNSEFGISGVSETPPSIISGNIIAYNVGPGVLSISDAVNTIRFNAIFANTGLGIERDNNDGQPTSNGAPVLTSVADGVVTGWLNSDPNSVFVVDFYANPANDASPAAPQGRFYLTSTTIETDASGHAIFSVPYTPFLGAPVLTATATDAAGITSEFSQPFSEPPLPLGYAISATGRTFTATTDMWFEGTVASFTSTAPMPKDTDFTAAINWGDNTSTMGAILAAPTGFIVLGEHEFAIANPSERVTVSIGEVNGAGAAIAHSLATVVDPVSAIGQSVQFVAGTLSSQVVASFTDSDPQAFPGQFTALIDWGDQTGTTTGVISSDGAGFDVTGSHAYNATGSYDITVTITDELTGQSYSVPAQAQVDPVPITIQPTNFAVSAGKRFKGTVANFTDGDPRTDPGFYTATIDWGDGSAPSTGTIAGTNPFAVTASHTFAAFTDTDIATITITDPNGRSVVGYDRIVDPPAPAPKSPAHLALTAHALALSPNKPFVGTVATLTDSDPTAPASAFKAIINWGKGRKSAGTITGNSGHYVVSARHVFPRFAGKKPVSVTVTGPDGQTLEVRELASYSARRLPAR